MSRSIHTTRKAVAQIEASKCASPEQKAQKFEAAAGKLQRKRRIKRQVAQERTRLAPPLAGSDCDTIPIEEHNSGAYVHHSASVNDLRAVLRLLPAAATEGIRSIKMILGKEYMEEQYSEEHDDRDPFTGRLSYEILPGVYGAVSLGTYAPGRGQITLHAHVYDRAKLPLEPRICELYLRLRTLTTFAHEVAHHHDEICRVSRGRWLADRFENFESYAEKMQYEWTQKIVIPYLEKAYAVDVKALLDFVEDKGGLRLPLGFFAGDSRNTLRNGLVRVAFSTSGAFENWVDELPRCTDLAASRVAFAWELHFADQYLECLEIVERVLADNPALHNALICKGDTLVHLERYDEALMIAEKVLVEDATQAEAWRIRGDVFQARRNWTALLENCDRWLATTAQDSESRLDAYQHRAVAYCGLDNIDKMETWIEAWANFGQRKRKTEYIRKAVYRRAGKAALRKE